MTSEPLGEQRAVRDSGSAGLEAELRVLRAEAELVDTLQVIGRRLTAQLDLDTLVQEATDAATRATRAEFGAFFYNLIDEYGESYTLYTLSGVPRHTFDKFPMPRNTAVFAPTFNGAGTVRSDDITRDPRYGRNAPYNGMPQGHLPVCSYLAVPVISPTSLEVLGGFFFGHSAPGRFSLRHEQLAEGIAGYTAIALDNARLFAAHRSLAVELARSMLPVVPQVTDLDVVSRYRPAAGGSEVGGDWFDVVELPAGRTAFVIGDVVGRGVTAAAVMGQIRTAVRAYALLDLPPADVLRHTSQLANSTPGATFITCFYAVHDPVDQTLAFANAGHLPAVLALPGQPPLLIGQGLGAPLGVGEDFGQGVADFPRGSQLTLYTDGLVENRERDLDHGIDALLDALGQLPREAGLENACDAMIDRLTDGRHNDDIALLHVRHVGHRRQIATLSLTGTPSDAAEARTFVGEHLDEWRLGDVVDAAVTVTSELVANAVLHTGEPKDLRLHHDGSRLIVEVADRGPDTPLLYQPASGEEHHRGLYLVNALTDRWGSRPTREGKIVWAELTIPPPP
ncbi:MULTISPECIES: SpoIIE family protein phosphatase [unclassified Kribbella]|uniref:ATP-binding SpoIIE family protein phosphatase n=1 Tax=unclassified Kribbella TaxID=2644121 RepID=UPI0033F3D9C2